MKEMDDFMNMWVIDPNNAKKVFQEYFDFLNNKGDVAFDFKASPGISYSLRAKNNAQKDRNLFTLIDVVDDEPENRWLSICFYADLVTDPQEMGDYVPGGLLGEDAICFNLEEDDQETKKYILGRLDEAYKNAGKQE